MPGGPRGRDTRPVEARIAKLEAGVEYLQREVADVKADVRELRGELREFRGEVRADFNNLRSNLHGEIKAVGGEMQAGLVTARSETQAVRDLTLRLFLVTWGGLIAAILGLAGMMGRGFGWL